MKDFRLICLVRYIYKLISTVLSKRMSKVLRKVIGKCQHAFMEDRQILDTMLMINEMVDDLLHRKREGILFKLDMEKTYDHIN